MAVIGSVAVNLTARTEAFEKSMKNATFIMGNFGSAMKSLVAGGAIALAAHKMMQFGKASVAAFVDADRAANTLANTLKQFGAGKQFDAIQKITQHTQNVTPFGDEDTARAIARFVQLTGLAGQELENIIPAAIGLSAVMDSDLNASFEAMAKAVQGNFGQFSKLGIMFADTATDQDKLNQVIEAGSRAYPTVVSRIDSIGGAWDRLKNKFNDLQESIGEKIIWGPAMIARLMGPRGSELTDAMITPFDRQKALPLKMLSQSHFRNRNMELFGLAGPPEPTDRLPTLPPLVSIRRDAADVAADKIKGREMLADMRSRERTEQRMSRLQLEHQVAVDHGMDSRATELQRQINYMERINALNKEFAQGQKEIAEIAKLMIDGEGARADFIKDETDRLGTFRVEMMKLVEQLGPFETNKGKGVGMLNIGDFSPRSPLALERGGFTSEFIKTATDQLGQLRKIERNTRDKKTTGLTIGA